MQNFVAQKAANYLEDTLQTRVDIGRFTTDWRNTFVLKEVYLEDQQQDTLWYSERLGIDMRILSLLKGELNISTVDLDNATLKLHIREDSTTNFDFLAEAFATDTSTAQPADTAAAMPINLGLVDLSNVYLVFKDDAGGNYIKARVGELVTTMERLDLDAQHYLVDEVELRNTWVDFKQTKLSPESESEPLELEFGINKVALEKVKLNYLSYVSNQRIALNVGESELISDNINLKDAVIDLKSFKLHNTDVLYVQDKYTPTDSLSVNPKRTAENLDESVEETQGEAVDWVLRLADLDVKNLDVKFDNANAPQLAQGMDYDHLYFKDVLLNADDIMYSLNRTRANINQLQLKEKSGFTLQNLQANLKLDSTSASLTNLDIKTPNTHLQRSIALTYPSFEAMANQPETIGLDININNSYIGMRDVAYFAPDLTKEPAFKQVANSTIKLDAEAKGTLKDLYVQHLVLDGLQNTYVNAKGRLKNTTDPENLYMDIVIDRLTTSRTDIMALLPAGTMPPEFRLPANITLEGNYTGTLTNFDAVADVQSSFGNLQANVDMGANEQFTATVKSGGFDLGQLFTDSLGLGTVALNATANGVGLTPEKMKAQIQATVQRLDYNNYTYNDIKLRANIDQNLYSVKASAQDNNLNFNLTGDFNLRNTQQPAYNFDLDLGTADLKALNLYPDPLKVKGQLRGQFTGADANSLSGQLRANNLVVAHQNKNYPIDTLLLNLEQVGEKSTINVTSDIADAQMQFANSLETLPTALQKHFSNYFDLQPDPPFPANLNLGDFTAQVNLKKTGLIASFVPGLKQVNTQGPITAIYNGNTQQLNLNGRVSKLVYTDFTLHDIGLQVRGNKERLNYDLTLRKLISPSLKVQHAAITGGAYDDYLQLKLKIAGADSTATEFMLGGMFNSLGKGYRFTFNPDEVIISGDVWNVPEENSLQFDTNLLYANNIELRRNNSSIKLNSTGPVTPSAPLNINISNLDLGYLMSAFQPSDSLLVKGTLNGQASVRNILTDNLSFTSDLNIDQFTYQEVLVGDLALEANSAGQNRFDLLAKLTGNGNMVTIDGIMETQTQATLLNLNANIDNLNVASLQGFTTGIVDDLDGSAKGNMKIAGTLENPNIAGQLNFDQAQFKLTTLGSLYTLQNERLLFNESGISFPNFTVTDSLGNDMVVRGDILTQNYTDFKFDLDINTDKFLALNSTAKDNELFYGTVYMAANATVTGDMQVPVVNVRATVLEGSDFTTVIPADEAGAAERDGIVEFVNLSPSLTKIVDKPTADTTEISGFTGAEIEAEIRVSDEVPITIVIDPLTGDNLTVRGTADPLFIGMRPSGEINMSGRYTVKDGKYSMDFYDLASRELDILEGSYINWTGDPLQADMNITAAYNVKTAPQELVASQAGGTLNPALRNQVPFQVYVYVKGDILKPEISFDIQLPENQRGKVPPEVVSSLGNLRQDESELNKQVFALLVLNRFLAPDPLSSSGGGFAASARNSLSQVMTDQLNQLTNRYAGGLGLEFGVDSYQDYSSGAAEGRTDLNVALRQQFLNDRLTVKVGTDIGLEGGSQSNQTMSGFGGDVSVEYSLTEDGRLRVRGFQRNQYEGIIEGGDVRATGVSLIFVKEYNSFSDLFREVENRRAREAERRQEELNKLKAEEQKQ